MLFLASEENTTKERQQPKKKEGKEKIFFAGTLMVSMGLDSLTHKMHNICSSQQSLCNIFKS